MKSWKLLEKAHDDQEEVEGNNDKGSILEAQIMLFLIVKISMS